MVIIQIDFKIFIISLSRKSILLLVLRAWHKCLDILGAHSLSPSLQRHTGPLLILLGKQVVHPSRLGMRLCRHPKNRPDPGLERLRRTRNLL